MRTGAPDPSLERTGAQGEVSAAARALSWRAHFLVLFAGLAVRLAVSLSGYSGEGRCCMYGDFEAQRHWMEVTANLPLADWYRNTTDNDLLYWGLDYPPLTAYHSYAMGKMFQIVHPPLVQLHRSRGIEGDYIRFLMRSTAWLSDVIVFFPAIVVCVHTLFGHLPRKSQMGVLLRLLLQPALILIDHGHFQYNCISLGLAVFSVAALGKDRVILGAVVFCLSLGYKHMGMYYVPAVAGFYIGHCLRHRKPLLEVFKCACAVLLTLTALFAPFYCAGGWPSLIAAITRLFPFNRGLYEDKVANVWCTISFAIKLHRILALNQQILLCTVLTGLACLPSFFLGVRRPSSENLVVAMAGSSLSFFLFSFQVHEKSFLVPLVPLALLPPHEIPILQILPYAAAFSMFPLLYKDNLVLAYFCSLLIYGVCCSGSQLQTKHHSSLKQYFFLFLFILAMTLHLVHSTLLPPSNLPDLFTLGFTSLSCLYFFIVWVALHVRIGSLLCKN